MKKKIAVGACSAAAILLIFVILFTSADYWMRNRTFIQRQYARSTISRDMGISTEDLTKSYFRLVDYMHGDAADINIVVSQNGNKITMFRDAQEISHMADVRTLYGRFAEIRTTALIAAGILLAVAAVLSFRSFLHSAAKGYCTGTFILLLPVTLIGTWAALDFTNFWNFFHEALFWNGDWLFPAESRMIQMLPEEFFRALVLRIVITAGAAILLLLILSFLTVHLWHKHEEKRYEEALEKNRRHKKDLRIQKAAAQAMADAEAGIVREKKKKHPAEDGEAPRRKKKKAKSGEVSE